MQLVTTEQLIINEPIEGREEIPIFPMSAEEEAGLLNIENKNCIFCNTDLQKHMKTIRYWQYLGWSPKKILVSLKRKTVIPKKNGVPVTSAVNFERLLGKHTMHCIGESHETYTKHWMNTLDNERMKVSLRERMLQTGLETQPTLNDSGKYGPVSSMGSAQTVIIDPMVTEGMSTADMIKEIITGQLKSMVIENRKYMQLVQSGQDCKPPSMEPLRKTLQSLKDLCGSFEVAGILNEIPGASAMLEGVD